MPRACWLCCVALITLTLFTAPLPAEDWPQWRGPNRDDVSGETGLLDRWPAGGPPRVWLSREAGLGYSGVAVVGDTLYTMGARGNDEHIMALNVADGNLKWSTPVGRLMTEGHGNGPRGTPTVDGDRVYALTGRGTLACVRGSDGGVVWKVEMQDLGGRTPHWGYTESVLVDGGRVVCTPGGNRGTMVALNKATGELAWQSKDLTDDAHYSSIIVAEHGGKRQYIQLTESSLFGIDSAGGDLLWRTDFPGQTAVIPTPIFRDGYVYATAGYNAGCLLVRLDDANQPTEMYSNRNMTNHHGGVVLVGDYLYGFSDGRGWTCQHLQTGEIVWNERGKLGKGCLTYADGKLYLLDERSGNVVLIDASPDGWNERGRFTLEPQTTQRSSRGAIWTHPVIAHGKLYLRDQELLYCFDVKKE
jgi:outer membrane protein assembly factor BamB